MMQRFAMLNRLVYSAKENVSQNINNGGDTSRSFNLSGFSSVEQHGVANLNIIQTSGKYSIEVSGTPELVEAIDVYVKNGALFIDQGKSSVKGRAHLNVVISMP